MIIFNYHTHTKFCDGTDEPISYIHEAIKNKMSYLGFSGHAPLTIENHWSLTDENISDYFYTINNLKQQFKTKINILTGLEIDYIPGITRDFDYYRQNYNIDYCIGSIHLVRHNNNKDLWFIDDTAEGYRNGLKNIFGGNARLAVETFYNQTIEMINTNKLDIVGHLDKIKMNNKNEFFSEDEQWYKNIVKLTIDAIEKHKPIVEVNTRGIYKKRCDSLYPSIEILEELCFRNIPITVSSDAHQPIELTNHLSETHQTLKDIGFKEIWGIVGNKQIRFEL